MDFFFTTDWFGAMDTCLGEQVAEAFEAVGKLIPRGESLAGELRLAAVTNEALLVPRLVVVAHPSSGDGLRDVEKNTSLSCS